ncbi:MAG: DUF4290 domain-containing protein [Bacteroidetes bacterium]|nr:MAG: DUF4290 domain-containing protein [Bacteroidota bacterium]
MTDFPYMDYYISETPLRLREFGRNIQGMIEYTLTLEDKDKRTAMAHEIIRMILTLKPSLKEEPDYKQKLWDALFIMSDYQLDVDAPYPAPEREVIESRPSERMPYDKPRTRYKQYGRNVYLMIEEALKMEEGEKRTAYINAIANTMKLFLRSSDREGNAPQIIADHIREISQGRLEADPRHIHLTKMPPPIKQAPKKSKSSRKRSRRRRPSNKKH